MNLIDSVNLVMRLLQWSKKHQNPVRQQAVRVLEAFKAHGVARTQINELLPQALRLPLYCWSDPDELKTALRQEHIEWLIGRFSLQRDWLAGLGESANQDVFSYKQPALLHEWFNANGAKDSGYGFKLYLITSDTAEIGPSTAGPFALILEQMADDPDEPPNFIHLSEGAHFDHYPCLVHLLQVQAIAYFHGAIMWRSTLAPSDLHPLSLNQGLIPQWLDRCRTHPLNPDHELWPHFSATTPWLADLREHAKQGLLRSGLGNIVDRLIADEARFARTNNRLCD